MSRRRRILRGLLGSPRASPSPCLRIAAFSRSGALRAWIGVASRGHGGHR